MTEDEDPVAVGIRLVNLIETGSRESTYKLAVLLALCHHSVEHSEDESGLGLEVPLDALSERVIELYWPQLEPFGDQSSSPLLQVVRGQSAILGEIQGLRTLALRQFGAPALWRATSLPDYRRARRSVAIHLARYPLAHLQRTNRGKAHDPFLYDDSALRKKMTIAELDAIGWRIVLRPGIGGALAALTPLLAPFLEAAWVRDVAHWNPARVDESAIERYLFGLSRTALDAVRAPLVDQQRGRCFYCSDRLREVHVDHVLPWSRTGLDDLSNLVACDPRWNLDKSASIPTSVHLARAVERTGLREVATELEWQFQPDRVRRVADALLRSSPLGIRLWDGPNTYEMLTADSRPRHLARI